MRNRIEAFGLSRVPKASDKARTGLELVASLLLQPSTSKRMLQSGPLNPYPFEPPPSAITLALRAKMEEARAAVARRAERERERERERLEAEAAPPKEATLPRDPPPIGAKGTAGAVTREELERGRVWREKWRAAVRRGIVRGRGTICQWTGFLCDEIP